MLIEKLQPAKQQDVSFYLPYFPSNKRNLLPLALSLYQQGLLEGRRKIENHPGIPFVATWNVSNLPVDLTRCRLQFDSSADLCYEVTMMNSELVDFLIEVIQNFQRDRTTDFSQTFYRKLLRHEL